MTSSEQMLYEKLGFQVENEQVKTLEKKIDVFDQEVPAGVRPATNEEIALWNALVACEDLLA